MDEHPGAGGGGGMAAAPRPQQPPPQSGGNVNLQPGGGCAGAGAGGGGQQQPQGPAAPGGQEAAGPAELSRPQHYTIPGILHYIQHEWARFEMERAHWEVERAELQARIAFLQGERKGQENLKKDLVRRIKMLEYALKQERAKYHKLKYGTELNQGDLKMPTFESEETKDTEVPAVPQNSQLTWKQGRQLLRQYLQEVGYTDTILDVRSQRVRSLLGLSNSEPNGSVETKNLEQILNGGESPSSKQKGQEIKRNSGDVLETFNFLENADDSDEEEESDMIEDIAEGKEKHRINKKHKIGNEGLAADLTDDPDTEEALKEFDFLVTAEDGEGAGEARSSGDGTEWAEPITFPSGGGKSFIMGSDDVLLSVLGLGDLADLTVTNDADYSYDLPANKDAFRKTWNPKYTLRSHFDGVRALAFHPVEPVLVTASEDHTLKLWNLQKTVPAKKSASLDVEPIYTFRAHIGPVLSLAISSNGEQCFSGGIDATIQWWNMPSPNVDPYDTYEPNVLAGTLVAHTDAVWGLAYSGVKNHLLSCSADGTIRLWNPPEKMPCICTYNGEKEHGIPTSVDFIGCDPAHMVASFNTGSTVIYDLETSQSVVMLSSQVESGVQSNNHINKVVSHPTLPVTITAHEDRHIKFFDNKTGKMIHSMVAHLDAVTSLAVDPNGIYLMSGSHDCSIRLWNLDSKTCVQEITAHRKKLDESIYDVAFHPSKAYIASAGADALAKVFV
ncbi:striatin-3 isoform X2 [Centrocercus urophasianus]|uniref:Striatin 3 n=1 Tax=Gallus gallus TaxID=9031 RepID=A0A1D5PD87_CHICK|nr:striatin-3 isoform X5 [Gallus gallus]XP_040529946.1 striatin-3 isoform X5 [Gallus gallus]XP_042669336.1 striatin-3 isoform X2 [Centrocercus urophasianus]XP_042751117.1 striatin-3 isoform X2 [Lagopus leucura]XP_048805228.1 striatin-3 isoform X4 [Lagopus muta]XP_052550659.1 striatin-3 isoform X4 [Tympanuchus pallidicinctus]|eukprot:XP_015143121.1 striatin-3 isoform X5 [Gallus gallus]